jgi:hypothetical protein
MSGAEPEKELTVARYILSIAVAMALACGGMADDPTQWTDSERAAAEAAVPEYDATEDDAQPAEFGQLRLALTYEAGFGRGGLAGADFGGDRCWVPASPGQVCYIPHDKKVRFKWTGAETSSHTPSMTGARSWKAMHDAAARSLCAELNSVGWDCALTTGSTNEAMRIASIGGTSVGSSNVTNIDGPVNNGQPLGTTRKYHGCDNKVSAANFSAAGFNSLTESTQEQWAKKTIKHELMHCVGFAHLPQHNYPDIMTPDIGPDANFAMSALDLGHAASFFP